MKEAVKSKKIKKIVEIPGMEVTGVTRMGGYYRWDWKFPFRHFVKEETFVFTKNAVYKLENN